MYCSNCGKENSADARFCRECGKPMAAPPVTPSVTAPVGGPQEPVSKKKWVIPVAILSVIAVIIAVVCFVSSRKPTVDMATYARISTTGFDHYSYGTVSVDWNHFTRDYQDVLDYTDKVPQNIRVEYPKAIDAFMEYAAPKLSKSRDFANGDELYIYVNDCERISKWFTVNVKCTQEKHTVSGLLEEKYFYPMDKLTVEWGKIGIYCSPRLVTTWFDTKGYHRTYDITFNGSTKLDNIKEGDTIVVRVIMDSQDKFDWAMKEGAIPVLEKEYVAELNMD